MNSGFSDQLIWSVIIGMGVVNFCLRFIPMATISRMSLPAPIMKWLSYVPIAVMGALFAKEILLPALDVMDTVPLYLNPGIYGALIAMAAFKKTRSFMGSTMAGIIGFLILRWVFTFLVT